MSQAGLRITDGFAPEAKALRQAFEERFAPDSNARFAWDYWHQPGLYTHLRTPAWLAFPKALYQAFHSRLVWWGRRTLGCHDVTPPWLSCYVDGCGQELHGDKPHGPFAFVFSLTRRQAFEGGQTVILKDSVLDYWNGFASGGGLERDDLFEAIAPRFNRLTVFDPRVPHGVRTVRGPHDVREGRLVIHGWFVAPRPFIEGPLRQAQLGDGIAQLTAALEAPLAQAPPLAGLLSLGFRVSAGGRVEAAKVLADTLRAPAQARAELARVRRVALGAVRRLDFGRQRAASRVTLPLVFERG